MNASDERGIKIVREKIKSFAQRSVSGAKLDGFPSPSFKIIILDEADTMTKEAQGALRRIMETYSNVTRFCLICNYVSRIIEPLVSRCVHLLAKEYVALRCSKLRFATLDHESMRMRLHVIAGVQDIAYDEAVYEKILNYSGGDMRRAVMLFQSCVICYGSKGPITTDVLEGISGEIPSLLMKSLWISAKQKDFAAMSGIIVCIMLQGYSATCCLSNIHDAVLANTMIHDEGKAIIFEAIAAADKNVSDGANADLQLRAVCSCICERRPSQ
mmetsp:Transcript_30781/g.95213  ORF Transcript_30781/g.95213 Transcript_30781/m.95213 type:complete len:271 (+) Transcript_30781:1807-2619(+)